MSLKWIIVFLNLLIVKLTNMLNLIFTGFLRNPGTLICQFYRFSIELIGD